jgi:hypothetical protein
MYSRWEVARWLGATPRVLERCLGGMAPVGRTDRWFGVEMEALRIVEKEAFRISDERRGE